MAKRRLMRRQVVIAALVGSLAGSGCVRTVTYRAARFEPGVAALPTTQPVRTAAVWKVKVRGNGEKEYHGIDGTERLLQRGDVVGFRRGDDGVVYATANNDRIPLALTDDHQRVVWQAKERKPTEFGAVAGEVGRFTAQILIGAAAVAGVGVVLFLAATNDDDDCDEFNY
jgi:hypothetical protein